MFALGLAGCGAGGVDCRVNDLGVSRCGNLFLCNDDLIADRAMLALGLAGLGAGGFNCRVNDLGVSLRGYFLHAGESLAADRAFFAGFMTSLGAGSGLFRNFNRSMSSCVDCFGFGLVADRAGVGLDTGILTGRRGRDLALIPTVALGGNLFLCYKHFIANRAMFALGLAGCGAGSFNSIINDFGVTLGGDFLNSGDRCAADRALCAGCVSGLGAGCGLFSNLNGSMGSSDFSRLGRIAAITLASALFFALFRAGRGSRYSPFAPVMTKRGNNLTVSDLLMAVLAVGIAGIAILGASGVFRVADLGVLM